MMLFWFLDIKPVKQTETLCNSCASVALNVQSISLGINGEESVESTLDSSCRHSGRSLDRRRNVDQLPICSVV